MTAQDFLCKAENQHEGTKFTKIPFVSLVPFVAQFLSLSRCGPRLAPS